MTRFYGPVTAEIQGDKQVVLAVSRVNQHVSDLSLPMKASGLSLWQRFQVAFFASEIDLFASRGASGRGGTWKPLSPSYAEWKARRYPGMPILQASGAMKESLVGMGPGHIFTQGRRAMEIGTHEKAGWHWRTRKPIDIGDAAEKQYFGHALAAWGLDLRREWDG